jgi:O-acetylserine/cysteine efflux transporter
MRPLHIAQAVLIAMIWGGNFVAVKLATAAFPPIFLVALRFLFVAALMLPFVGWLPRRCLWPVLAVSAALGCAHFALMFLGVSRVDASTAAIAAQLGVPFSTVLAVVFFGERLGGRRLLGVIVAFSGVVVLAGTPQLDGAWGGLLILIAATFAWAVGNLLIKRFGPFDPYLLTAWMALFAVPQLLVVSALAEQGQVQSLLSADATAWAALAYIVIGASLIAYTLWYSLINANPVSQVVPFTLLAPVFALAAAASLLGEAITLPLLVGGALTLAGVGLCELSFSRLRRRKPEVVVAPD